jgi:PAS domain S-box-containing protein
MNARLSNKDASPGPPAPGTNAPRPGWAALLRQPEWLAYALAVAGNVVTLCVYLALPFTTDTQPAPIVFLLPIIFSAYVGGLGPGLVSTGLATLGAIYFLMPPLYSFYLAKPVDYVRLATLIVAGVLISVLNEALHRSRQRAEASQRLQAITLASIGDAVITTDRQGCITFLNAEAEHLTGWTRQEAVGQPLTLIFRIVNEQTRQPVEDPAQKVLRCGTVVGLANHTLLLARDGREIPIDDSGAPIQQADGTLQGVVLVFRDFSERKQAEQVIQRQAHLLNIAFDAILVWELEGAITFWNRGAEVLYGFAADQALGRVSHDLLKTWHPQGIEFFKNELKRTGSWMGVLQHCTHDGRQIEVESYQQVVQEADGRRLVFESNRDITARQQAEAALRESEARLRLAQQVARIGTFEWNMQTGVNRWTPELEAMYGLPPGGFPGTQAAWEQLVYADDRPEAVRWVKEALEQGSFEGEWRVRWPDGTLRWLAGRAWVFKDEAGQPRRLLGVNIDITERKRAEEAMQESQRRNELLANIIELSSQAFGMGYPDGRLGLTNQGFERLTGYTRDELRAIDWAKTLTPPEWRELEQKQLEELRRTGQPVRYEKEYVRKDGTRVPIELLVQLVADADGKPAYYYSFITDITERKRMEESRLRSQKLEALGTLAGGIAHDFNNILLTISGNTELAAADLPPQHPARENLAEIARAGARATDLVRRILTFSRPQEQQRQVLELQPVVEEALKLLRATLPTLLEIRTQFAPAVPAVTADATQIHQVIVNLATNAAHAIGPRGGLIEFRLDALHVSAELARTSPNLREGHYTRLSVSDNGCGMDQATLERIFDPFFTTKPAGQGTGLGLSVVHGIMQSHGGAVTAYSQPGKGSTFRLYFPAVEGTVSTAAVTPREVARGRGERVLYIDDEEALVSLATRMLKRLGCTVTGYTNPVSALAEFRSRPGDFDVVVTDLSMPGMSGFELSQALQDIRPDVPIILSSGYIGPEDQATAERLRIRALILKPNTMKELGQVLQQLGANSGPGETTP